MTHLRGAESFTLRRIASSSAIVKDSHEKSTAAAATDRPERNSRQDTQIKSAEGDLAAVAAPIAGYVGGRLVTQRSPVTDKRRAHSDGHVPSDSFDLSDSDQVEAVVSIQIVKQDLPSADGIVIEDNNIHSHSEYRPRKIHHLTANRVTSLGQQWQLVKQFIVSDYYFGELNELAKEHFLQKMLKGLISQQSQN